MLAANTEASLCCNGGHGVANSVVRGGGAAAAWITEEMDLERVKTPAALARMVRSRAKLRQAKARAQSDQEQVAGELKRSDDGRRREPSLHLRSSCRAQTSAVGIRGGVLEKGGNGGDGNGGRHALLDAARVREDKAREGWHRGPGRGREKGKCVAEGHLERECAGPHSGNGRRKERAVRHSEPRKEARRNVAPAAEERRGDSLSRRRKAETPG